MHQCIFFGAGRTGIYTVRSASTQSRYLLNCTRDLPAMLQHITRKIQYVLLQCLLVGASMSAHAQTHLWTDTYNGGIVVGSFSIGDQASGIGALYMQLPGGATVRRSTMYAVNIGGFPSDSVSITLGSIPITFNPSTAGPVFYSTYGPVVLHSVDLTSVLDPTIGLYTLDASHDFTNFKEFILITEYELAGAGPITVDIFHCNLDSQLEENYTVHTTFPMATDAPVAFATMGAYALNEWVDYETVIVNGTVLGRFHGADFNAAAGNNFGACATFHYANGTFEGVGDDDPDQAIEGADVLSELSGLVAHGDQSFQVTYRHSPTTLPMQQSDNIVNMMVVAYSGIPCFPTVDLLGPDTTLCAGDSLLLDATRPGAQYLWQDGTTDATFLVTDPGTYHVQWLHPECEWDADSIVVEYVSAPFTGFTGDLEICNGATVVIGGTPVPDVNYSWSDGSTEMPRTVNSEGLYTLIATVDGCSFTDSVAVLESDCDHLVELPNVFTPNGDGSNAVFMPISMLGVDRLSFTVYNRWGQVVFQTTSMDLNWDGRTGAGKPVPDGVYFWILEHVPSHAPDTLISTHGSVTLLR